MGFEFIGFIAESPEDLPVRRGLGHMEELDKILERHSIDAIVVALEAERQLPEAELLAAKLRGVRVASGLSLYERVTGRVYLRGLRAKHLIFSNGFRMGWAAASAKRALDVTVAGAGLLVAAPILALAALAIALESPGPVLFRQQRVGRGGRLFALVKLRSMVDGAEARSGPVWAAGRSDPRVTRIGRWLRRTRLDEVPQLWNVLRGDMSLVGPRPERPEFVEQLSQEYPYFRLRSSVRPGLTGWAQVRHGYVNDLEGAQEKLALDLFYMKYQSFALDLWIVWKTVRTVILLQGV